LGFNLPAALLEIIHRAGGPPEMVGEEDRPALISIYFHQRDDPEQMCAGARLMAGRRKGAVLQKQPATFLAYKLHEISLAQFV
jgi:hypothetical protein